MDSSILKRDMPRFKDMYYIDAKVGEGTFGVVYKAYVNEKGNKGDCVAIKSFKGTQGISFTTCREISILQELKHENIVGLREVFLEPNKKQQALYMVFEYAEYDLCEILKHHRDAIKQHVNLGTIKSFMYQILNGMNYLHSNWVIHRDLKPSNILVMGRGTEEGYVKIADFGLARVFKAPLRPLHENGVVVTIWYRSPELLLGSHHYTRAMDMWAIGCIFAELLICSPIFPGKEDSSTPRVFQKDQVEKIFSVLGSLTASKWPLCTTLPEWRNVSGWPPHERAFNSKMNNHRSDLQSTKALDLLAKMLEYDPAERISAAEALNHPYFKESPPPLMNSFKYNRDIDYPKRAPLPKNKK
jgi:cyclin-dependent kinase 8/11